MRTLHIHSFVVLVAPLAFLAGCTNRTESATRAHKSDSIASTPYFLILGIAQDGGYPQAGCAKPCCAPAWANPALRSGVACAAIVDPATRQRWLIDATPSFIDELRLLDETAPPQSTPDLTGILLTHAHIGHYTGLMHLGREAIGAKNVPVYAMPRMQQFLENNGPWGQLVRLNNIVLRPLSADKSVPLNDRITATPLLVPHRDEYSETVGIVIRGPHRAVLYISDIDKWDRWDRRIEDVLAGVDAAYLDGTFFADGEIRNRTMAEVPHPFIVETLARLAPLSPGERAKVHFIHLNHTNPALHEHSAARQKIESAGCHVARVGERLDL